MAATIAFAEAFGTPNYDFYNATYCGGGLHTTFFNTFGTTMVYVALPAIVGARMCVNGDVESGVITADSLNPAKFFAGMEARGVPFEFDEQTTTPE